MNLATLFVLERTKRCWCVALCYCVRTAWCRLIDRVLMTGLNKHASADCSWVRQAAVNRAPVNHVIRSMTISRQLLRYTLIFC